MKVQIKKKGQVRIMNLSEKGKVNIMDLWE